MSGAGALLRIVLASFAAASGAEARTGSDLAARLGEEWRWREHDLGRPDFVPTSVTPLDQGRVLLLSGAGVARFDGVRLDVPPGWDLRSPVGQAARLGEAVVARMRGGFGLLGEEGLLWHKRVEASSDQGLGQLLVRRDGAIVVCRGDEIVEVDARGVRPYAAGPVPDARLLALGEDDRGRLWTATFVGLHRREPAGWKTYPLDGLGIDPKTIGRAVTAGGRIHFLPVAEAREVLGATWDGERLVPLDVSAIDASAEPTVVDGALVTSSWIGELFVHDGREWRSAAPAILRGERVRALCWNESGRLTAVTALGRVVSCDVRSERWREYHAFEGGPWNVINALEPRPEGGYWVGSAAGVARFADGRFERVAEEVDGTPLQAITALAEDEEGGLWIGSGASFRGVAHLVGDDLHLHTEAAGVGDAFVHAVRHGRDGALWFALIDNYREPALAGGLARLDVRRSSEDGWVRYDAEDGLASNRCYDVLDTPERTLAATARHSSRLVDGAWRDFGVGDRPLRMFRVFETRAGELWGGPGIGNRGLYRFEDGAFRAMTGPGLARISASDFAETEDGRLWVTGEHGLALVDGDGLVHEIGAEPGAPAVRCWPIVAGDDGALWIGSLGRGLLRYRPDDAAAPVVLDASIRSSDAGLVLRLTGRDAWDTTPQERLRYRIRVDDEPWSVPFSAAELPLPRLRSGATVSAQALDLAGNRSAPSTTPYRPPPDPGLAWRRAGAASILALLALALFLQVRRRRERLEARERSRRRLLASERRYRAMVEGADVVLCSYDADGHASYVSPRLAEICGVPPDSLDPTTLAARVHPDDAGALEEQAERRRRGEGDPRGVEFRLRDAQGGWRWFWQVQSARTDAADRVVGFDTVALDVTERRRLQEALLQAQKLESLGVLAGGVAHDFNNLLVGVIGNAELLRRKLEDRPELDRLAARIERAGTEAGLLCRRMLAYAGRAQIDDATLDLVALVGETAELLGSAVPASTSLEIVPAPAAPLWIEGDEAQLKQIVLNLVLNAAESIGERRGRIEVRTFAVDAPPSLGDSFVVDHLDRRSPAVVLEVSDDGTGLAPAEASRIFDPFFSTKFEGRGLGLAAVAGIVKAHRGAIEVASEVGAGATFRIWLPAARAGRASIESPSRPSARLRGRVLLVDDDEAVAGVARAMLEEIGLEADVAPGGDPALRTWRRDAGRYDVVLLDVTMPDRDGVEVLRELRRIDPSVRVILTTGFAREETEARCRGTPPAGFLAKPYSSSDLERELRRVLDRSATTRGTA